MDIPKHIQKSQEDYLSLLTRHKKLFDGKISSLKDIAFMTETIKCFWHNKVEILKFELDEITNKNESFLLTGAIYLDTAEFEHYYFKSLGKYHLIADPFLRLDNYFLAPEGTLDFAETYEYLKKTYFDTVNVLNSYQNHFLFLPIREIVTRNNSEHQDLINTFFLKFISNLFDCEFKSDLEFYDKYKTFEDIEKEMIDQLRDKLIFNNLDDIGLSLRKKIEGYAKKGMNFSALQKNKSEAQIFWIITYSYVAQIAEILSMCTYIGAIPYIRFFMTFYYLTTVIPAFIQNKELRAIIEKTFIFYVLRKCIDEDTFKSIDFNRYCLAASKAPLLNKIISQVHEAKIDIFRGGFNRVAEIIAKEFSSIIKGI